MENPDSSDGTIKRPDYSVTRLDAGTPYPLGSGTLSDITLEPRKKTEVDSTLEVAPSEVVGASGIVARVSRNEIITLLISGESTVGFAGQEGMSTYALSAQVQ